MCLKFEETKTDYISNCGHFQTHNRLVFLFIKKEKKVNTKKTSVILQLFCKSLLKGQTGNLDVTQCFKPQLHFSAHFRNSTTLLTPCLQHVWHKNNCSKTKTKNYSQELKFAETIIQIMCCSS